jgi:hypothetical protein
VPEAPIPAVNNFDSPISLLDRVALGKLSDQGGDVRLYWKESNSRVQFKEVY